MKDNAVLMGWGDDEHDLINAASKNTMMVMPPILPITFPP